MCSFFQLIVFINTFLFQKIIGNIVTVGDYSELNPGNCGLSTHSIGVNTTCLKWHNKHFSPILYGNDVRLGDAPWVAFLKLYNDYKGKCTGSVIADQWILTAAHCLAISEFGYYDIHIYLGHSHNSTSKEFDIINGLTANISHYIHPKYNFSNNKLYDIGLIRMNKPLNASAHPLEVNSICLPPKWSPINGTDCQFKPTPNCKHTEYVMSAGWGSDYYQELDNSQMGYWRLHNIRWTLSTDPKADVGVMYMRNLNAQACKGDSGAPVWQYDMGRAVIIGVRVSIRLDAFGCEIYEEIYNYTSFATFVDEEIDWIKSVTMLN